MSTLCQVLVLEIEQKTVKSFCSYEAFILGRLDNKEIIKAMQDILDGSNKGGWDFKTGIGGLINIYL